MGVIERCIQPNGRYGNEQQVSIPKRFKSWRQRYIPITLEQANDFVEKLLLGVRVCMEWKGQRQPIQCFGPAKRIVPLKVSCIL